MPPFITPLFFLLLAGFALVFLPGGAETWQRFQREGKRSVLLKRAVKPGVVIGSIIGVGGAVFLVVHGTHRVPLPVAVVSIIAASVCLFPLSLCLWYLLLWERLRRKFSPS